MEEQDKDPENIQLSNEEIANLSDSQFKTLVIRKLTELVEFGPKLDEKNKNRTSSQDGGVGRYTLPPHKTKRRTTTNLKTKNNQNCHSGRNSQSHRKVRWRDPQGPRTYTSPPTRKSAPEDPNLLVGSRGND